MDDRPVLKPGNECQQILEYAKKFGLDSDTGLEGQLEERNGRVPSEEQKIENTKVQLKYALERTMRTHFEGIDYEENRDEFEEKSETAGCKNKGGEFNEKNKIIT